MPKQLITTLVLLSSTAPSIAGVLKEGTWIANGCGVRQGPPVVDATTVDSYNASVKAINEWQKTAKAFDDCIVKEANADNAVIAKSATEEQGKLKEIVKKINDELNTGRELLDQKRKGYL